MPIKNCSVIQVEADNDSESVLVTTSTGIDIESDGNAVPQQKKKYRRGKHLVGYISRRRAMVRKRAEVRKRSKPAEENINYHEAGETSTSENMGMTSNGVEDLIIYTQRVRKTVQPYMHMVPPRQFKKKKVDSGDEDESSKQYINPMHLKQEQNKMAKASNSGGGAVTGTNKPPVNSILNHFQAISPPRNKNRINYNEDLVDEAFMYEEMLLNKPKTQKNYPAQQQAKNKAIDDAVKMLGTEITLVPLSSKKNSSVNNNNSSCSSASSSSSIGSTTKLSQSNLTLDGLSIYRKSSASQPSASSIQISDIKSLCSKKAPKSDKSQPKTCKFCKNVFGDEKQLAAHQLKHLSIAAVKLDNKNILSAHHRRVSVDIETLLIFAQFFFSSNFFSLFSCGSFRVEW